MGIQAIGTEADVGMAIEESGRLGLLDRSL
jgi:hypothetical protein